MWRPVIYLPILSSPFFLALQSLFPLQNSFHQMEQSTSPWSKEVCVTQIGSIIVLLGIFLMDLSTKGYLFPVTFLWASSCLIHQTCSLRSDCVVIPPLLPSLFLLLYVFGCRRSFLVGSCLLHQWLLCPEVWFWFAPERRWAQALFVSAISLPIPAIWINTCHFSPLHYCILFANIHLTKGNGLAEPRVKDKGRRHCKIMEQGVCLQEGATVGELGPLLQLTTVPNKCVMYKWASGWPSLWEWREELGVTENYALNLAGRILWVGNFARSLLIYHLKSFSY